ncbi:AraC family transcriptional regulator [Alteromonas sp. D210916BOD_24]|uniref:helix-turn-helix domain-containing protein n=1 Tax=Alteromonas sp. D210916BOD_24 TaxID=3157618 RepID=UPI00399CB38E
MENLTRLLEQHNFTTSVDYSGQFKGRKHIGQTGVLYIVEAGHLRVKGKGELDILMDRPSILLLPKSTAHIIEQIGELPVTLTLIRVSFCINQHSILVDALPTMMYLQLSLSCSISCTARLLLNELQAQQVGRESMITKLGEMLYLHLIRYATEKGHLNSNMVSAISHPQISRVIRAVHAKPAQPWTLETLASIAAMSRSKFAESFRLVVGQTPNDYVTDLRLSLAKQLLKRNHSVHAVAHEVGYEHASALARIFKKRIGLSPKQWRSENAVAF